MDSRDVVRVDGRGWRPIVVALVIVVSLVGARFVAHALISRSLDGVDPSTGLLLETVAVGAVLALGFWTLVLLPWQRRQSLQRAHVRPVPNRSSSGGRMLATTASGRAGSPRVVGDRPVRHLSLVPAWQEPDR